MIKLRKNGNETGIVDIAFQDHGFPWNGQTVFRFGTNREPLEILSQRVFYIQVKRMTSVIAELVAQETATDSDADCMHARVASFEVLIPPQGFFNFAGVNNFPWHVSPS